MSGRARQKWLLVGALVLPAAAAGQAQQAADDSIVVVGRRLDVTKIDYRLRGAMLAYCGARDRGQDAAAVRTTCAIVGQCVRKGALRRPALSACVDAAFARQDASPDE